VLNRAGIPCEEVDTAKLVICPKHRYKLTTLYKAKVSNNRNTAVLTFSFSEHAQ